MASNKTQVEYPSDREMVFTRVFDAPRELVWAAHTEPAHVARWWGPQGFTNTIHEMDVRPGGLWRLTMHGPDGTDYPNRIEFLEVVKPARLVYHHGDDANPRMFHVTTTFTAEGGRTKIVSRMRFKTPEECAEEKKFAVNGHNSTMDRLDAQLAGMTNGDGEIVISRVFAAPRDLVFSAWTEPHHLARWWGPRGFTNPTCEWDARPGGEIHDVMRAPNGTDFPMGGEFREIVAPEKIVFTSGALDAQGRMMFEFRHTVTFVAQNEKTAVTVRSRLVQTSAGVEKYTNGFEAGMTQSLERLTELVEGDAAREIVISRVFSAPRELVWAAMTDPQHVVNWWGPRGFTTTITQMDVRPGGVWEHVMRGPDGTNYPNKSVFKEVVKPERIVYAHGGRREGGPGVSFEATWTFEVVEGNKTRLTLRQLYASAEQRDFVAREFGAVEGGRQTLTRLSEHLAARQSRPFVITREFDAPRALVWQAWTERDRLMQWFGPKGFTMPVAKMDFRPGGMFHYCLTAPNGAPLWGKFVYREIVPTEKLVWVNSFSDPAGGTTPHPFTRDPWPLHMLTVVTFAENAGKTTVTVNWLPLDATEDERKTFDAGRESMTQGWGGTMEQLKDYLAKA